MTATLDAVGSPPAAERARGRAGWDLYERRVQATERIEAPMLMPWDAETGMPAARAALQEAADRHLMEVAGCIDAERQRKRALHDFVLDSLEARRQIAEALGSDALLRMSPTAMARVERLMESAEMSSFGDGLLVSDLLRQTEAIRTRTVAHHLAASMRQAIPTLSPERLEALVRARQAGPSLCLSIGTA